MPLFQSEVTLERVTAANAAHTTVASSASSVTILAANPDRVGATIFNRSSKKLYLNLGGTAASTTAFTVLMGPNTYYEVPFDFVDDIFGIWDAVNGDAQVTELTP